MGFSTPLSFFASSFTLISSSTSLWLLALLFTSMESQTSRSSASWSAEAAVKRMHCDTCSNQGWEPEPGPAAPAGFSLPGHWCQYQRSPKTLTASCAWWHTRGSMWHMTEKRKTKINHTSKDGVHQFGVKEKWSKPWCIIGMYWLRALQDPWQTGFWSISYLFDGETV